METDTPGTIERLDYVAPEAQAAQELLAELNAALALPEEKRDQRGFSIMGRAQGDLVRAGVLADYLIGVVGDLDKLGERVRAEYDRHFQPLTAWKLDQLARTETARERVVALLRAFYEEVIPAKERTIRRPTGIITRREYKEKMVIDAEDEAIIEWLRQHDAEGGYERCVKMVEVLDRKAMLAELAEGPNGTLVYKATGEYFVEVSGGDIAVEEKLGHLEPGHETFSVKPLVEARLLDRDTEGGA